MSPLVYQFFGSQIERRHFNKHCRCSSLLWAVHFFSDDLGTAPAHTQDGWPQPPPQPCRHSGPSRQQLSPRESRPAPLLRQRGWPAQSKGPHVDARTELPSPGEEDGHKPPSPEARERAEEGPRLDQRGTFTNSCPQRFSLAAKLLFRKPLGLGHPLPTQLGLEVPPLGGEGFPVTMVQQSASPHACVPGGSAKPQLQPVPATDTQPEVSSQNE